MIAFMDADEEIWAHCQHFSIGLRKLNIPVVFVLESYFKLSKSIMLNSAHYFIKKIKNFNK